MKRRDWIRIFVLSFVATGLPLYLLSSSDLTQKTHAYSSGPPAGFTHAPGEFDCAECHVPDGPQSGQTTLTVPSTYVPGQTYQITVRNINSAPSRIRWGFQLTALDDGAVKAGNLQSTDGFTQVLNNQGSFPTRQYIEHTTAGNFSGQLGGSLWTFNWTAPSTDVGRVTFYVAGNQANGDGNTSGDMIHFAFAESQPAAASTNFSFSSSGYTINESSAFATINVNRTGDTSAAATVKYATSDATDVNFVCNPSTAGQIVGAASRKCDYHIAAGRLRFAPGETSKQIILSIVNDVYVEGPEVLTINLADPTGGALGSPNLATVTIDDNDTPGQANPIDGTAFYVRQLYVDLLSREPDASGADWVHRIDFCGQPGEPPPPCDRVTVGGVGFLSSSEFFDRQFFVIRLYRTALGRILRYDDVGDLAYVSGFLTTADLETNKQELVTDIMSRSEFINIYNPLGNSQYVDTMIQTAAVSLPGGVRDGWVSALDGSTKTRAQVFRELSERPEVSAKYLHEAQVVSCYYGFFTRNPDAAYFTFLQQLDSGQITLQDLAGAFINAGEYRQRFGP